MDERTVLTWIDLETTGLDRDNGRILEFAAVFTDLELNRLAMVDGVVPQPVEELTPLMNEYVTEMHTKNGLLQDLEHHAHTTYENGVLQSEGKIIGALNNVRRVVSDHEVKVLFVIAGNTVSFDKGWIETHMPSLFRELHYRQLDVSSYKVGFPELFGTATSADHRALNDILDSIAQQQKMRDIVGARL